ncbi:hypothetical protein JR316_0008422 [Psilocybe cubensis]|uniref:Uncharacterized protein n=2 Tax=Psilocybe cubensis TaxID=181762 RepID=A0A8H7XWA1_PSICU|nr:hypothetical protein JR316_0008422 [Psilocybe cubensis]KAH9479827.1 hypothetical protein JR316_0008422 [Psilocybe cubensis]
MASSSLLSYENLIADYARQLDELSHIDENRSPDDDYDEEFKSKFQSILVGLAGVVRAAETDADSNPNSKLASELPGLIAKVDDVMNKGISFAYEGDDESRMYLDGWMPSFAHCNDGPNATPLLEIKKANDTGLHLPPDMLESLSFLMMKFVKGQNRRRGDDSPDIDSFKSQFKPPEGWETTPHPSVLSSPCARFQSDFILSECSGTPEHENVAALVKAQCEVSCDDINDPVKLCISSGGDLLALSAMGGYKNRTPFLHCYYPKDAAPRATGSSTRWEDNLGSMRSKDRKLGLSGVVADLALDESRQLIFAADQMRIKSYRYDKTQKVEKKTRNGARDAGFRAVHTFDCSGSFEGPLSVFSDRGRVLRAGQHGTVAIWDIDAQPTHGRSGSEIVGEKYDYEDMDSWRDDPEEIELSGGSEHSQTVNLDTCDGEGARAVHWSVEYWHRHPSSTNVMLCGSDVGTSEVYHCHAFDIEAGGKAVARYLGHAGLVRGFSTSPAADPNVFLTSCDDGHSRLYDTRRSLPVLTIAAEDASEAPMNSALLVYPDGLPFIFVGEAKYQKIVLWDVRAQKALYELATGNNNVRTMAWDNSSNTLYAATECTYVDRIGYHHDYRRAKIPREKYPSEENQSDMDIDDDEIADNEPDSEDDWDDERCWPRNAYHRENYWGHVWDAGDHRLYKYEFKKEPNLEIVPEYGRATVDSDNYYW